VFGNSSKIHSGRADADVLQLVFQQADQLNPAKLKELLAEHLRGFRETFRGKASRHAAGEG
jgi:hypothetical protein